MADEIDLEELCDLEAANVRFSKKDDERPTTPNNTQITVPDPEVEEMILGVREEKPQKEQVTFLMIEKGSPPKITEVKKEELPKNVRMQEEDDLKKFASLELRSAELLNTTFTTKEYAERCLSAYAKAKSQKT